MNILTKQYLLVLAALMYVPLNLIGMSGPRIQNIRLAIKDLITDVKNAQTHSDLERANERLSKLTNLGSEDKIAINQLVQDYKNAYNQQEEVIAKAIGKAPNLPQEKSQKQGTKFNWVQQSDGSWKQVEGGEVNQDISIAQTIYAYVELIVDKGFPGKGQSSSEVFRKFFNELVENERNPSKLKELIPTLDELDKELAVKKEEQFTLSQARQLVEKVRPTLNVIANDLYKDSHDFLDNLVTKLPEYLRDLSRARDNYFNSWTDISGTLWKDLTDNIPNTKTEFEGKFE